MVEIELVESGERNTADHEADGPVASLWLMKHEIKQLKKQVQDLKDQAIIKAEQQRKADSSLNHTLKNLMLVAIAVLEVLWNEQELSKKVCPQ